MEARPRQQSRLARIACHRTNYGCLRFERSTPRAWQQSNDMLHRCNFQNGCSCDRIVEPDWSMINPPEYRGSTSTKSAPTQTHGHLCASSPSYAERPLARLTPGARRRRGDTFISIALPRIAVAVSAPDGSGGVVESTGRVDREGFKCATTTPASDARHRSNPTSRANANIRSFSGATCPMLSENPRSTQ